MYVRSYTDAANITLVSVFKAETNDDYNSATAIVNSIHRYSALADCYDTVDRPDKYLGGFTLEDLSWVA